MDKKIDESKLNVIKKIIFNDGHELEIDGHTAYAVFVSFPPGYLKDVDSDMGATLVRMKGYQNIKHNYQLAMSIKKTAQEMRDVVDKKFDDKDDVLDTLRELHAIKKTIGEKGYENCNKECKEYAEKLIQLGIKNPLFMKLTDKRLKSKSDTETFIKENIGIIKAITDFYGFDVGTDDLINRLDILRKRKDEENEREKVN
jgi:hypothetical protein